jgi:hypothetical protein
VRFQGGSCSGRNWRSLPLGIGSEHICRNIDRAADRYGRRVWCSRGGVIEVDPCKLWVNNVGQKSIKKKGMMDDHVRNNVGIDDESKSRFNLRFMVSHIHKEVF